MIAYLSINTFTDADGIVVDLGNTYVTVASGATQGPADAMLQSTCFFYLWICYIRIFSFAYYVNVF